MVRPNFTGFRPDTPDSRDAELDPKNLALSNPPLHPEFNIYHDQSLKKKNLQDDTPTSIGPYHPHLYNQLGTNTCVLNAVAAAYNCALQRQGTVTKFTPSRMFLYYVVRALEIRRARQSAGVNDGKKTSQWLSDLANNPPTQPIREDNGCEIRDACKVICYLGACSEHNEHRGVGRVHDREMWPFFREVGLDNAPKTFQDFNDYTVENAPADDQETGFEKRPKEPEGAIQYKNPHSLGRQVPKPEAFKNAVKHHSLQFSRPPVENGHQSVNMWKKCIVSGYPLILAYNVYNGTKEQDDQFEKDFIAYDPQSGTKTKPGGHVVLAVGWNDNVGGGCFRIQDSYGTRFDGGFWWMPYKWLSMSAPNSNGDTMAGSEPWILLESFNAP